MNFLEHRFVDCSDGVALHAVGGGPGPLMLFLHGFPEFWYAWKRQLLHFRESHSAVALDLRGYNSSDKPYPLSAYKLERLVEDVRTTIETLGDGTPAVVVGHDWGGIVAWAFARAYPDWLDRLIILNAPHPAVFRRELARSRAQRWASSYIWLFRRRWLPEKLLRACHFAALRKMVFGQAAHPQAFSAADRAAYMEAWSQPGALTGGLNYYRANRELASPGESAIQGKIQVPTLVIWGEKDPALLPGNLYGLENYVQNLEVRRIPSATHWVVHEEPERVNKAIAQFCVEGVRA